uniref:Uncharacterized protein n=1 Tax=Klebsiella phage vB_Kpn30-P2 TaxID=3230855 RepID=A0AAU8EFH5_9VIRU
MGRTAGAPLTLIINSERRIIMFKLIETLGRMVIALYIREAKALDKASKVEAKAAAKLAKAADKARQASLDATAEAAKVAAKAQKLKEFF